VKIDRAHNADAFEEVGLAGHRAFQNAVIRFVREDRIPLDQGATIWATR
jgi:hypothetical protein